VLILGSLPSTVSLERGQYYAHSRNAFWTIMGKLFGASRDLPYAARLLRLKECGIALWDVCASACRPGRLDSKISDAAVNDFNAFFSSHRGIKLICFNGAEAHKIFRRQILPGLAPEFAAIRREVLPSTSPAHAGMGLEEKIERWRDVLNSALRSGSVPRTSVLSRKPDYELSSSTYGRSGSRRMAHGVRRWEIISCAK
jgi:hypoxanthine-DNA glycosylase